MEGLLVFLALVAAGWILVGPILVILLYRRMNDAEHRLSQLEFWRHRSAAKPLPHEPVVKEAPKPRPAASDDFWLDELASQKKLPARPKRKPFEPAKPTPPVAVAERDENATERPSIEELLAGKWLTWVGAVAVIVAVGFFFKYAIDTELIDETGRVVIGIVAGVACFAGGFFAMTRDYRWLAQSLVGASLGILYFSFFAAYHWYELTPQGPAFVGMILATTAALSFAGYFQAQPTAVLGLIGGFLTPLMLSTGQDAQWSLFSYILLLDVGVLGLATFRKWQPTQILAFLATLLIWLGWFEQHYTAEKLAATLTLMTAFFALFALLGVWSNLVRREQAAPADFFLILATPVAYFGGLYAVTLQNYFHLHGLLATALAGLYVILGLISFARFPAGRRTMLALGGVATTFLTLAVPLQFTGHWVVIVWALESLILVELGLRFGEINLRRAGFGLLIVVQLLLSFYAAGTFADPDHFQTRFSHVDPLIRDTGPARIVSPTTTDQASEESWTSVFNGRSLSFLASALVLAILAWEYRTRFAPGKTAGLTEANQSADPTRAGPASQLAVWLPLATPLVVWAMFMVETYAFGHEYAWRFPNFSSAFLIGTAMIGTVVALMPRMLRQRELKYGAMGIFAVLSVMFLISFLGTLLNWENDWQEIHRQGEAGWWGLLALNPRGFGFLSAIASLCFAAYLFHQDRDSSTIADKRIDSLQNVDLSAALGVLAYISLVLMLTAEIFAQGVVRDWGAATNLLITLTWTVCAVLTIIAGIIFRSGPLRILSLALFLITTAKVFLYDVWQLDTAIRFLAFGALGVSLFLVSFLYRRYSDRIRAWVTPHSPRKPAAPKTGGPVHGS